MQTLTKQVRFKHISEKKFFAVSDIHGDYNALVKTLETNGFKYNNKHHILIVAGDIIEGSAGAEEVLLQLLAALNRENRLLAVQGNHDWRYTANHQKEDLNIKYWDKSAMSLSKSSFNFLKSLPIAIKTPYFNVVHGMWDDSAVDEMSKTDIKFLLNASPCLIGTKEFHNKYFKFSNYKSKNKYVNTLKKPTFIGHFYKYLFDKPISSFQDVEGVRIIHQHTPEDNATLSKGAKRVGNLIMLDNDVKTTKDLDAFVFTINEKGKVREVK